MLTLQEAKLYLRIDESYTEEDTEIEQYIIVADEYLRDGISNYDDKLLNKRFVTKVKMLQKMIVQYFYDERYMIGDNNTGRNFTYPIQSMMKQMEYGEYLEDKDV